MQNLSTMFDNSKKLLRLHLEEEVETIVKNTVSDDTYPFEYFMDIPSRMKRLKFFEDIKIGDVVIGSISRILTSKLEICLICSTGTLVRDIYNLKIPATCSSNELPILSNFSSVRAFRHNDLVKAIVINIKRNENIELSMNQDHSFNVLKQLDLGLFSNEKLPTYHKILTDSSNPPEYFYNCFTKQSLSNSMEIKDKLEFYGLETSRFSLLDAVNRIEIKPEETAKSLRNSLLIKESKKFVMRGVECYKHGKNSEALRCYNQALSICESNVDALVARGALRASLKSFELSIDDLEKAVEIEPNHKNAALYLSKTIIAYSKSLPKSEIEKAEKLVKKQIVLENEMRDKSRRDISNPNNFIIISDDELSNCSKSSVSKSRERKKRKHKKQKKSRRKKSTSINLISSDESCDSRTKKSSPSSSESSAQSSKHKKYKKSSHSKKSKRRRLSPQSPHNKSLKRNHDSHKSTSKSYKRRKRSSSSSSSSSSHDNWHNVSVDLENKSFDYRDEKKTSRKSHKHDDKEMRINLSSYEIDVRQKSSSNDKFNSFINLQRYSTSDYRWPRRSFDFSKHGEFNKQEFNGFKDMDKSNFIDLVRNPNVNHMNLDQKFHDEPSMSNRGSFNPSTECIDSSMIENRKLRAADEEIRRIEEFISQLRNNVKQ